MCACVCDVRKYVDGVRECVGTGQAVGIVVKRSSGRRIAVHKSFLKSGTYKARFKINETFSK